jgi:hypothetical protein
MGLIVGAAGIGCLLTALLQTRLAPALAIGAA